MILPAMQYTVGTGSDRDIEVLNLAVECYPLLKCPRFATQARLLPSILP